MLLLTRKTGEGVDLIDKASGRVIATVNVLAFLPNDTVRLGFIAPPSVSILRDNAKRRTENGDEESGEDNEDDDNRGNR